MNSLVSLSKIRKVFGQKTVLNDISIDINQGDYISVVGESGAGKSTFMNIIGLLDRNYDGDYYYNGKRLTLREQDGFRNRHIGFIFQQYNLISNISAKENVMLPYTYYNGSLYNIENRCSELFERFGLTSQMNQIVNTLSGGEKQRVALMRSILLDPEIVLADEPTGNLDKNNSIIIRDFLKDINSEGKTIVVVTHDMSFANDASIKLKIESGGLYERV